MTNHALTYLNEARNIIDRIAATQLDAIAQAAEVCASTIAGRGLVYLFGTGHSRIPIEEIFPRHGSFPGFYPLVELSLTFHNQVVGANGQRQAMYLEHVPQLAAQILRNFVIRPPDSFMIFSNSGVNELVVEMALRAKALNIPVMCVVSIDHASRSASKHVSGKKLHEICDIVIDNCTPAGDAMVSVDGLQDPVGPGSTVGYAAVVNALKCQIAGLLVKKGAPPLVLTSAVLAGSERSAKLFDESYDDFRARALRAYGA
jgi:uncharacterized phosphosugar-binding protein